MANMSGKVKREFDAAAAVTLRALTDGSETADAAETGVALNTLSGAYWDNNDQPNGDIRVSVHVTALDKTTGDETYDIYFETDSTLGFASAVEVARLFHVGATGYYEVVIPSTLIEALDPTAKYLRARLDVAGTTPIITYGAWMTFAGI